MILQTEHSFLLPRGLVDADGRLHREGKMRLATAADEIIPLKDPRVRENPEYLVVVILSRVITSLGTLNRVETSDIESLFINDLAYLQDLYNRLNQMDEPYYEGDCPHCGKNLRIPINFQQAGR